ncbi:pyruvate kinase [Limibacter armeniacum]|uniref:pyruvate kinase n=1 Tax=Limibacter armeniacum TaxID=466084 RepID=UPI002FE5EA51
MQIIEQEKLDLIVKRIDDIYKQLLKVEKSFSQELKQVHSVHVASAYNLMHYVAMRSFDVRALQKLLSMLGLSSLGRSESHVLASIKALSESVNLLCAEERLKIRKPRVSFQDGENLLNEHAQQLLGVAPEERSVRIMVTMPSSIAEDYGEVEAMLRQGMNIARVNCAHDDVHVWKKMVGNIRKASREVGKDCHILMDLAGPKLRTSPLEPGPSILSWRPDRDETGEIVAPALIWLAPPSILPDAEADEDGILPVPEKWVKLLQEGDIIHFHDRRGKKRQLVVRKIEENGVWATAKETAYIEPGIKLRVVREGKKIKSCKVGAIPPIERPIVLYVGDTLLITKDALEGRPAIEGKKGKVTSPAMVGCPLPEIYQAVKKGEIVRLDDGKIEGVVRKVSKDLIELEITQAKEKGSKLKAEKGINFPQTQIQLSGLTPKDIEDLDFVAKHADIVSLSFVQEPSDVEKLYEELRKRDATDLGIVLKIETQKGFQQLTRLLLAAMKNKKVGVMIARGDLAVEHGWVRMAEIQEEILWLCEAAHIPVIWATQVLEGLAKKGLPSRAEITDAAMAQRAECVMLNKGPYIQSAIAMLEEILVAMERNQNKKTALLRKLSVAKNLLTDSR